MSDDDYKVGYKKPPLHTRFQKGKSGNPRGRPKRQPLTGQDIIKREMNRLIPVIENGVKTKITTHEALIRKLSSLAIKGEIRACQMLIMLQQQYEALNPPPPQPVKYIVEWGDEPAEQLPGMGEPLAIEAEPQVPEPPGEPESA
jgi:hypothetical protein